VDQNWYLDDGMANNSVIFYLRRVTISVNIRKRLNGVTFLTHPVYQ